MASQLADVELLCAANRLQIQAILLHLEEIGLPLWQGTDADTTELLTRVPDATAGATGGLAIVGSQMTVPDTQKVDVNTIKTKGVTVDTGGTTFPASIHAAGAAVAKSPATVAAGDGVDAAAALAIVNHATYGNAQLARTGTDGDTLADISGQLDTATADIYTARVDFKHNKISGNDEYTVYWYKNGAIQTGATGGKIGVQKNDAGGTTLVTADTAMTALSTTGAFFFAADNTAGKLWVTGQALVTVKATIGGAERTDYAIVGRQL